MQQTVAHQLIANHRIGGKLQVGEEIALEIDQTLTQDATGTLVMLELEALGVDRVATECSVQYVDHNLVQEDHKNPDDHLFLRSACRRFGVWYSRPGNGVSHPTHQDQFGVPGKTLLGSDSHTPAAGAIGMLAFGAGGLEVALAMAGEPFHVEMPEIWGVELVGELPDWVSAKDVVLEMLRRHGVDGGVGRIIEYYGPGLDGLDVMDRHVIANMGTELGATSTVFPSDGEVRRFLAARGREGDWREIVAASDAEYDVDERIDLGTLEPLIAMPSSPGNVRRVSEVAGEPIYQAYIGSSANPGFRDFAVAAEMVEGRQVHPAVSFDINPTSRPMLMDLMRSGHLESLVAAGARLHQAGCNGCIGMGQAPATGKISLRTVPRNFPGRSGTRDDAVCLVSPETATASALEGVITDPRQLDRRYPEVREPDNPTRIAGLVEAPPESGEGVELVKGPNIKSLPTLEPIGESLELPVLLIAPDDVSTDEIMPAGTEILPYRSNIEKISEFCFSRIDTSYAERAREARRAEGGHAVVGGDNYGQGSSREHAALAPRFLGLRLVLAKSFARIHRQNLCNFGVLPLTFASADDHPAIERGDVLRLDDIRQRLEQGQATIPVENTTQGTIYTTEHGMSRRQITMILAGSSFDAYRQSRERYLPG